MNHLSSIQKLYKNKILLMLWLFLSNIKQNHATLAPLHPPSSAMNVCLNKFKNVKNTILSAPSINKTETGPNLYWKSRLCHCWFVFATPSGSIWFVSKFGLPSTDDLEVSDAFWSLVCTCLVSHNFLAFPIARMSSSCFCCCSYMKLDKE